MFRSFGIGIAMLIGSHPVVDAQPVPSKAALQCLSVAGVMHESRSGLLKTLEPHIVLPPCRAAQTEAREAAPIVQFAAGQGLMTSRNHQEIEVGVTLIERAADAGLPQAHKQRDRCTGFNECLARDRRHGELALKYFASAAPKYGHAASALGYAHYYGAYGAGRDLNKAFENLTKAAEAGVPAAMRLLGPMYMNGRGAPLDKVRGLELVGLAAQMGDRQSQELMGDYALQGDGLQPNRALAIAWYQKAKNQGSSIAAEKLQRLGVREWTTGEKLLAVTITGIVLMALTPDGPEGRAKAEKSSKGPTCDYPWMPFDAYSCIHMDSQVIH